MVDNSSQNALGFSTNASYNRRIGRWFVGGSFNYAQNVSTLLITYTTSYYNYSGNVRRRFGNFNWSGSANFGHSGLTNQPGTEQQQPELTRPALGGNSTSISTPITPNRMASDLLPGRDTAAEPAADHTIGPDHPLRWDQLSDSGWEVTPIRKLTISASYSKSSPTR